MPNVADRPRLPRVKGVPVERLQDAVRAVERVSSHDERARCCARALAHLSEVEAALVAARDEAILALRESGWTLQEIATAVQLTRGRVHQILGQARPAPPVPG